MAAIYIYCCVRTCGCWRLRKAQRQATILASARSWTASVGFILGFNDGVNKKLNCKRTMLASTRSWTAIVGFIFMLCLMPNYSNTCCEFVNNLCWKHKTHYATLWKDLLQSSCKTPERAMLEGILECTARKTWYWCRFAGFMFRQIVATLPDTNTQIHEHLEKCISEPCRQRTQTQTWSIAEPIICQYECYCRKIVVSIQFYQRTIETAHTKADREHRKTDSWPEGQWWKANSAHTNTYRKHRRRNSQPQGQGWKTNSAHKSRQKASQSRFLTWRPMMKNKRPTFANIPLRERMHIARHTS